MTNILIVPDMRCQSIHCPERDALVDAVRELLRTVEEERAAHRAEIARLREIMRQMREAAGR